MCVSELGEVYWCIIAENQEKRDDSQKLPFFTGKESVPHFPSWKNILPLAQQCFATLLPEDMLGRDETRILAFPCFLLAWFFISLQFWNAFPWYIWKIGAGKMINFQNVTTYSLWRQALRIIRNAASQALLFCPHVLLRSAHSICPSPSRPRDFQTFTLQP